MKPDLVKGQVYNMAFDIRVPLRQPVKLMCQELPESETRHLGVESPGSVTSLRAHAYEPDSNEYLDEYSKVCLVFASVDAT